MDHQIEKYLNDMKFKKVRFGGVEEEDVLRRIEELCLLYDEAQHGIQEEVNELKKDLAAAKAALVGIKSEAEEKEKENSVLKEEASLLRKKINERRREEADDVSRRESEVAKIEKIRRECEKKYAEISETLTCVQEIKRNVVMKAKIEAAQEASKIRNEIVSKAEKDRTDAEDKARGMRNEVQELRALEKKIFENIHQEQTRVFGLINDFIDVMLTMRDRFEPCKKLEANNGAKKGVAKREVKRNE